MSNKFETTYRLKSTEDSGDEESQSKDNQKAEKNPLPSIEISPNEHKLQYAYALWYSRRSPGKTNIQSYDQNLKLVGRFASVEQFWGLYSHLVRPSDLTTHTDFHLFKVGIKPMWEDEANQKGGKWIVRLRKGLVSRCWENLILAILGEQFMVGEEICGAVVSIRFQEDIICVWNKTASDVTITARIRDTLRRVLHLPPTSTMEYKTHNDSLKNVHRNL
ncbi:PREDICTED: eukaryotic translation initiation factor 4E type 2-like isoform X1 [Trachymyrmex septentrionalis]|uniref:eukaryotic translation initiation factor 4E type 2-like isoform X1 n=1 Tax=Trachymyrmex septentrionalis TaxID=34720 RepID=UPI00084F58FE|nr:PREDICTED: eukaryotic translation initiation factor 4E type 2-like isoform X1 [Trachymyrmex septentrionalis]